MKEHDLQKGIMNLLKPVVEMNRGNAGKFKAMDGDRYIDGLPKGFPDLFGVILADKTRDGRAVPVFIECKVKPNRPTAEQKEFIRIHTEGGCAAAVCYTVSDAWRLIRPYIRPELDVYPEEVLRRWEILSG